MGSRKTAGSGLVIGVVIAALAACREDDCKGPDRCAAAPAVLVDLELSPPAPTLQAINGGRPSETFTLKATWSDGQDRPVVDPRFEVRPVTVGRFDPSTMTFTASGKVAGSGALLARVGDRQASARLTVALEATQLGAGVSIADVEPFDGDPIQGTAEAVEVVYPLDGAVMPQNAPPITIQWNGGQLGDVLRIRWSTPDLRFTRYVLNDGPTFLDADQVPADTWRALTLSAVEAPVELVVDRMVEGRVYASQPIHLRFAEAALEGTIYYRSTQPDRLIAVDNRDGRPRQILPRPPLGCMGCHSVSGSGRYLAARFGTIEDEGGVFDLTADLTSSVASTVLWLRVPWWFSTFSPDDRRLLLSLDELGQGGTALYELPSGRAITPLEGALPSGLVSHPSWAPDGSAIAYLSNLDVWGGLNTTGDLYLLPVLGLDRFGEATRRVAGDALATPDAPGRAISYPTWSPDARWLAFAHGTIAESRTGTSAVYLVHRRDGDPVRLDLASGPPTNADAFEPRFSPAHQGGYYWLCYLSRRDYGNKKAGTAGTGRQQIWVSAIKDSAPTGTDPSEVGYWLEGQGTAGPNISAFWARRACRADAEVCATPEQCCSDVCGGDGRCAPRATACAPIAEPCRDNADCCDGARCLDARCGGVD